MSSGARRDSVWPRPTHVRVGSVSSDAWALPAGGWRPSACASYILRVLLLHLAQHVERVCVCECACGRVRTPRTKYVEGWVVLKNHSLSVCQPSGVPLLSLDSSRLVVSAAARAAARAPRMRARRGASSRYRAGVRSGDPVPIPDPISERSDRIGSAPGGLLAACGAGLSPHRTRPCAPARRAPDFSRPFGFRGLGRRSAPLAPLRSAPLAPLRSAPLRSPRPAGRA